MYDPMDMDMTSMYSGYSPYAAPYSGGYNGYGHGPYSSYYPRRGGLMRSRSLGSLRRRGLGMYGSSMLY
jgi:hypothetical protein